jgi:valyl-tRNA synthetase
MSKDLSKAYSHQDVEKKWYRLWLEGGYFEPRRPGAPPFSMVIPPPNVTGSLHMGHALNNTLQDILARYKRMDGANVLWIPGTDHAGIATQNVVERQLAERGLSRNDLGREKFIERVWAWRDEAGGTILNQLKALGVSCDWSRERFTMDERLSRAVRTAFVGLWNDGLLYRAERLINWCPRCKTALADIEVVHEEADGHLWHIRYPLKDDPTVAVVVATTRPETMLGDTAVAVHPDDPRYRSLIGKIVRLPITGREAPIIGDSFVDVEFGTGALKITPAHDFNDFEIGEKYGLEKISIFDEAARIDPAAFTAAGKTPEWVERYALKDRAEARKLVVEELERQGWLAKVEPYRHSLGRCYRCQTAIEPFLTPQWFVKIKPLAEPAIRAVRDGSIRIIPEGWSNSYFAWMEEIKDWCISRQIWWGHQIPAWYCTACNSKEIIQTGDGNFTLTREARPIVGLEVPSDCPQCGGASFVQDPDVLDTWFSSALWPFSTLGWPERTEDIDTFYPTSVLVTGFDILFFWVARMIMMGLKFMDDVPFRDVYIHALVRDQEGQKMSKSKGNVIDPLDVIDRYGTDAFRFTLAALAAMGRDVKLSEERISGYQNFVNKLWNASRFVLMNIKDIDAGAASVAAVSRIEGLNLADRWILSRLARATEEARKAVESYRFNEIAHHLYQFTWHEFCDWYIEMSKLSLNGSSGDDPEKTRRVLLAVLKQVLLLLHPIMPFVTEEIWQAFKESAQPAAKEPWSIMVQDYPRPRFESIEPEVEERVTFLIDVIRSIRNLRTEMNFPPSKQAAVAFRGAEENLAFLKSQELYLRALARLNSVEYLTAGETPKTGVTAVVGTTEIHLTVAAAVDLGGETARLSKEMEKLASEMDRTQKKLGNPEFIAKAKTEVIRKERDKSLELEEKMRALRRSLETMQQLAKEGAQE